jgi:hypothetical protein
METPLAAYNYLRAACHSDVTYCLTVILARDSIAVISAE